MRGGCRAKGSWQLKRGDGHHIEAGVVPVVPFLTEAESDLQVRPTAKSLLQQGASVPQ
jgi:hypothetical protein